MSGSKKTSDGKMCEHVLAIYRYYLKPESERTSSDYFRMVANYYILTTELKPIKLTGMWRDSEDSLIEKFKSVLKNIRKV